MGATPVANSLEINFFSSSFTPNPHPLIKKLPPTLQLKQLNRSQDGSTIYFQRVDSNNSHQLQANKSKNIKQLPIQNTISCTLQPNRARTTKSSSVHVYPQAKNCLSYNKNMKNQSVSSATGTGMTGLNSQNTQARREKRNKSGIQCKSKLFKAYPVLHTDRARVDNGVNKQENQMGQQMYNKEQKCPEKYVLRTLSHATNEEYDRSIELSALLLSQKNKKSKQKLSKNLYNIELISHEVINKGIFCETAAISIQILFQYFGSHTLIDQIASRKTSLQIAKANQQNSCFSNVLEDQNQKAFTTVELLEIANFMLKAAEESIEENQNLLEMENIYGKRMFALQFDPHHILMLKQKENYQYLSQRKPQKESRYRYRNIVESAFFYPHRNIAQVDNDQASGKNMVFNSATIFSIGLCLLSCYLLEDMHESIVSANGQICRSLLEQKVDRMRQKCSGEEGVCDFIEMLLMWPIHVQTMLKEQNKSLTHKHSSNEEILKGSVFEDSMMSSSQNIFKPNILSPNWFQQVKRALKTLMHNLRIQQFTKYKTKQQKDEFGNSSNSDNTRNMISDLLQQDSVDIKNKALSFKSKNSCPSNMLGLEKYKSVYHKFSSNQISYSNYQSANLYKIGQQPTSTGIIPDVDTVIANENLHEQKNDISVVSLYTNEEALEKEAINKKQNELKQMNLETNNRLNMMSNNTYVSESTYAKVLGNNSKNPKQNDQNVSNLYNMKKNKNKSGRNSLKNQQNCQPECGKKETHSGSTTKNPKNSSFARSSAFKNKKIMSNHKEVIVRKQQQIQKIDEKWKMEESMFKNMPQFENFNSQVFSFNMKPEFEGKIERKLSAVGLSLLSHRD